MKSSKVRMICLETSYFNVELILFTLYKNYLKNEEELAKQASEISGKNISKTVVTNALPITNDMELTFKITKHFNKNLPGGIYLSSNGEKLVEAIKQENREKIRELAYEGVKKSAVLNIAYNFIKNNKEISYKDLGELIEKESNKNWKAPSTKNNVARSCIKLLHGFHVIGDINLKDISKVAISGKKIGGLRFTASGNQIFNYVKKLNFNEFIKVTYRFQSKRKNDKILSELTTLVDLGLVEKHDNRFKLTDVGKKLQDALDTSNEAKVFSEILLSYKPAKNFIYKLVDENKSYNIMDIGWKINEFNMADWVEDTARSHGTKFLNCMKRANIAIKNSERGKYRMNLSILEISSKDIDKNEKKREIKSKEQTQVKIPDKIMSKPSVSKDIDEYLEKSKFEGILYEFWLYDNWKSNDLLRKKIEDEVNRMKNIHEKNDNQILIEPILIWIEKAYDENDISYLRKAGIYYKRIKKIIYK